MSKPQGYIEADPTNVSCLYCKHSIIEIICCSMHECYCCVDFKPPSTPESIFHDIEPLGYCARFDRRDY